MINDEKDVVKKINVIRYERRELEVLLRNIKKNSIYDKNDIDIERVQYLFDEHWHALDAASYYLSELIKKGENND